MMKKERKQGGYTLLFAVLTATLVLGVAVFIVDLSRKQHELAVSARNSVYSFYAADSAMECAVSAENWEGTEGFASTTGGTLHCGASGSIAFSPVSPVVIYPDTIISSGSGLNIRRQWQAYIPLSFNNGTEQTTNCALLTITTGMNPANGIQFMKIIDARGYNTCTAVPAPDVSNSGTVERALRLVQTGIW